MFSQAGPGYVDTAIESYVTIMGEIQRTRDTLLFTNPRF